VTRTLYTVAFPGLSAADRRQIDTLRDRHDASNARIIPPHFTLVFACAVKDEQKYRDHVASVAARTPRIPFACREVLLDAADGREVTYVYLVASDGASQIVRLHGALYSGPLAQHLRMGLTYVPHITIGTFNSRTEAGSLCDRLNAEAISVEGVIDALSVGSLQENGFGIHATYPLRPAAIVE
jgi:2'-5' RNA ligase